MLSTLIIFTLVLSLLVLAHEFGHFLTARRSGVAVEEFGFGFPPRLFGIKKGKTIYSINWIPLGGFVKIKGESGDFKGDKDSFGSKSPWQRALILTAGVIMNFALAWALLSIGYLHGLPQIIEDLSPYASVREEKIQIVSVIKDSPADKAGLRTGDAVLTVDGKALASVEDFREYTLLKEGQPVVVEVRRPGETSAVDVTPETLPQTGRPGIGVALVRTGLVSYPWFIAPLQAIGTTYDFTREIILAFYGLLRDLVVSREVTVEFSGPVGIAVLTGEVAKLGIAYLIQFTALLSINLGVINILPFPALDGGRLAFLIAETVRGRAVSRRLEAVTHNIGFALLMALVLVITYRDVVRFGDRILKAIGRLFGA
jgi:regulator of sigma E protease